MKRILINVFIIIALFFTLNISCEALTYGGCQYSEISRLKSFVSNINVSYDYHIRENRAYFNITLSNIVPGIYFVDSQTGHTYNYNNTIDGEITLTGYTNTSGHYNFYSELSACHGVKLGNKYYNLPTYNYYYNDPLCNENRNHSLCKKWSNVTYSYSEFEKLIEAYNSKQNQDNDKNNTQVIYEKTYLDVLANFYTKYYYFILIGIIVICVVIMVINKKKNKFDI